MRIRFLLMNAYALGGTVRATLDAASALAADHDVEIVSVLRHRDEARFDLDPSVPVRTLVHLGDPAAGMHAPWEERRARRRHGVEDLAAEPSRLIHPKDSKHSRFSLLSDARLEAYLRSVDTDVLVGTRPGLNLAMARWVRPGVACVGQEHVPSDLHARRLRDAMALYYPRLDAITALTSHDVAAMRDLAGDVPVHRVPNMLPPLPPAEVDLDRKVVVAGGRISRPKGFDLLVRAWEHVHPHHPDWTLRIYGHGPDIDELKVQVEASPAAPSIELPGLTPGLAKELPNGSIFALPSRVEGFGLVLLEAMGLGLACVSFDCDHGPREIIEHGVDGLLVPAEDVAAMGAGIRRLIEDRDERHRLGAAAQRTARSYSPDALRARLETVFDDALREGGRRRRWKFGRPSW